jgi:hypothetical protein
VVVQSGIDEPRDLSAWYNSLSSSSQYYTPNCTISGCETRYPPASATKKNAPLKTPTPPGTAVVVVTSAPSRGGFHKTHTVYLGGSIIGNGWLLDGKYRYSTQRCDEKHIEKIEKHLIERRNANDDKKFNGTLDNASGKEPHKGQFVRALEPNVREHGHDTFYTTGKTVGGACMVHDKLTYYHI